MRVNNELARIFAEMAVILELTGADRFRVAAHDRAGRALNDLAVDVGTLATSEKSLTAIDGIGASSAKKIMEYAESGAVSAHRALLGKVPPGLLDVLKIPGLGPKTVKVLWKEGGVTDLNSLARRLESGELERLPRMGAKTVENIRASMRFAAQSGGRVRLGEVLPVAEQIVRLLSEVPGASAVRHAGSLRRGAETIGDIDVLACAEDPAALGEAFRSMEDVDRVLAAGPTKSSVRLARGLQVDLRVVAPASYGADLMYFTGSKAHNVRLRERAIRMGLRLNEYGLFPDEGDDEPPQNRGVEPVAARTEEEIYRALELPWLPPEVREDRGELEAEVPALIERADIRSELHAHTVASDGTFTIEELADEAKARGYEVVAVTDHSRASGQAGGLSIEDLRAHVAEVRAANDRIDGITILAGSEVDILADGRLDYPDEVLRDLDVVVASPHVALGQDPEAATKRLLKAITHPLVHIVGHPTGRLINKRPGLDPDIQALVQAAAAHGTALEINSSVLRLDLRDVHVRAAVDAGALIAIDTDAHTPSHLDQLRCGVLTARRGWLTAEGCVNTWPLPRLRKWLADKTTAPRAG